MKQIVNAEKFLPRRRELRQKQTEVERMFWSRVRDGRFFGLKFKRQYGIGSYILDFYCREKNLVIELDGSQHVENVEYDNARTKYLNSFGMTVLRFWNNDVMRDMDAVLESIRIKIGVRLNTAATALTRPSATLSRTRARVRRLPSASPALGGG